MTARCSLSHLSMLDATPRDLVSLAASAGFWAVGLRLNPAAAGAVHYPLRCGAPELIDLRQQLRDTGVRVYDVEFIPLTPDVDIREFLPMLEAAAELGAERLNVSGDDPDTSRLSGTLAALAEAANEFGLSIDLEFMRWRNTATLAQAADVVRRSGAANAAILLDSLHLFRSGGKASDVARLRNGRIQSVQLSDAPLSPPTDIGVIEEARNRRLAPGEGELPLADLVAALPQGVDIAVEVPAPPQLRTEPLVHLQRLRAAVDELLQPVHPRRAARAG
jgi:sugar phosphate isomerase/epimerase